MVGAAVGSEYPFGLGVFAIVAGLAACVYGLLIRLWRLRENEIMGGPPCVDADTPHAIQFAVLGGIMVLLGVGLVCCAVFGG
jgi:hypothetical protein